MEMNREFLDSLDVKNRFSRKVDNYIKFRPSYPNYLIEFMEKENFLKKGFKIADIGAGTGKFTELLLLAGYIVIAIEPNKPMLNACKEIYDHFKNLTCLEGSSEKTNLPQNSVDLIVSAQAFHWFKLEETMSEWKRILKPDRYVALIWNSRLKGEKASLFQREYEEFVRLYGKDYIQLQENFEVQKKIEILFEKNGYQEFHTEYEQKLKFEELKGRVLSSSYIPQPEDMIFPEMMSALKELFEKHQIDNLVTIQYDTELFYGKIH